MSKIRNKKVQFVDECLKLAFDNLFNGTTPEKNLFLFINRALDDLLANPEWGIKIPRALWPKNMS